jgi:hypothetical protein
MPGVFLTRQLLDIEEGINKEICIFLWLPFLAGHRTQPHFGEERAPAGIRWQQ